MLFSALALTAGYARAATVVRSNDQLNRILSTTKGPVLVDFSANWCENCTAMDQIKQYPNVRQYLERYKEVIIDNSVPLNSVRRLDLR
jgi:thiol:disulfide interchange protein